MVFYRWPCGIFENMEIAPSIYTLRPTPTTPQGDFVYHCKSKDEADKLVLYLNNKDFNLQEAINYCKNAETT